MLKCALPSSFTISDTSLESLKNYYEIQVYDPKNYNLEGIDVAVGSMNLIVPSSLKLLQLLSAGYDALDLSRLKKFNTRLCNASGTTSVAIAEFVIGILLLKYKQLDRFIDQQKANYWKQYHDLKEFTDKNIAILGTGSIGKEIAKRLNAFGCSITGYNSNGRSIEEFSNVHSISVLKNEIKNYDIVISCLPLNEGTRHLFDREMLLSMKKNAILVNVGRGGVVSLDAVLEVIDTHLGYVLFDVVEIEPLPADCPLWNHPKALITPHISYASDYRQQRLETLIVNNLLSFAKEMTLENEIII